jgi:FixJ family two-component response regulator
LKGQNGFTVFLVDDDASILRAISRLLTLEKFETQCFLSAGDFIAGYDPTAPSCALIDIAMDGFNGLQLQDHLLAHGIDTPIIFLTGKGDISSSVKAMKAGAVDFLTKPVARSDLLAAITKAMTIDDQRRHRRADLHSINTRLAALTPREREVFEHVVAGRLNKQIAGALGIVEKTVKVHRKHMMEKLGVRTVADLVRLSVRISFDKPDL